VAVIQTGEDSFFIAGTGVVITFKIKDDATQRVGLLKVDEGRFEGDKWHITRHLNGDQTHQGRHVRLPAGATGIQRVSLYRYR